MTHSISDIVIGLRVDEDFVQLLIREEIIRCEQGRISRASAERIRICWNMYDLGVNVEGLEVALHLMDQLEAERRRVQDLLATPPSDRNS